MTTTTNPVSPHEARVGALSQRGFQVNHNGWRGHGFDFRVNGPWLEIETAWPDNTDPLSAHFGKPGLWKPVRTGDRVRQLFAMPESIARDCERDHSGDGPSVFELFLDWAFDTATGSPPRNWVSPERPLIDASLPKNRLTIVEGAFARQVEIVHTAARLALRLQLLGNLPGGLPEHRVDCLRTLLLDEQDRHHLVRFGIVREQPAKPVVAEIDLTGIPAVLLEPMLSMSLDALRWVASRLVESADFISEPSIASRALEIWAASRNQPKGEKQR